MLLVLQSSHKTLGELLGCSRSAAVSIYGDLATGSLKHVGSEGWPVQSNPADDLLLLKLLKKLMLKGDQRIVRQVVIICLIDVNTICISKLFLTTVCIKTFTEPS